MTNDTTVHPRGFGIRISGSHYTGITILVTIKLLYSLNIAHPPHIPHAKRLENRRSRYNARSLTVASRREAQPLRSTRTCCHLAKLGQNGKLLHLLYTEGEELQAQAKVMRQVIQEHHLVVAGGRDVVLVCVGKPFLTSEREGVGVLARADGVAVLGCRGDVFCMLPLVRWARALPPGRTCSVGEAGPARDGRKLQVEPGCSWPPGSNEGAESSSKVGKPQSSFDDGRVVNTRLAVDDDRSFPRAGLNEGRLSNVESGRKGSSGGGRIWPILSRRSAERRSSGRKSSDTCTIWGANDETGSLFWRWQGVPSLFHLYPVTTG